MKVIYDSDSDKLLITPTNTLAAVSPREAWSLKLEVLKILYTNGTCVSSVYFWLVMISWQYKQTRVACLMQGFRSSHNGYFKREKQRKIKKTAAPHRLLWPAPQFWWINVRNSVEKCNIVLVHTGNGLVWVHRWALTARRELWWIGEGVLYPPMACACLLAPRCLGRHILQRDYKSSPSNRDLSDDNPESPFAKYISRFSSLSFSLYRYMFIARFLQTSTGLKWLAQWFPSRGILDWWVTISWTFLECGRGQGRGRDLSRNKFSYPDANSWRIIRVTGRIGAVCTRK